MGATTPSSRRPNYDEIDTVPEGGTARSPLRKLAKHQQATAYPERPAIEFLVRHPACRCRSPTGPYENFHHRSMAKKPRSAKAQRSTSPCGQSPDASPSGVAGKPPYLRASKFIDEQGRLQLTMNSSSSRQARPWPTSSDEHPAGVLRCRQPVRTRFDPSPVGGKWSPWCSEGARFSKSGHCAGSVAARLNWRKSRAVAGG